MPSTHTCYSHQVGKQSELVVFEALRDLQNRRLIAGFIQIDLPGIDFFIILKNYEFFPLQVKSSYEKAEKHLKRYPRIAVVVVPHRTLLERKMFRRSVRSTEERLSVVLPIAA